MKTNNLLIFNTGFLEIIKPPSRHQQDQRLVYLSGTIPGYTLPCIAGRRRSMPAQFRVSA